MSNVLSALLSLHFLGCQRLARPRERPRVRSKRHEKAMVGLLEPCAGLLACKSYWRQAADWYQKMSCFKKRALAANSVCQSCAQGALRRLIPSILIHFEPFFPCFSSFFTVDSGFLTGMS